MILALCCPAADCHHAIRVTDTTDGVDQLIDHITGAHELPEISAAFHAGIAKPVSLGAVDTRYQAA